MADGVRPREKRTLLQKHRAPGIDSYQIHRLSPKAGSTNIQVEVRTRTLQIMAKNHEKVRVRSVPSLPNTRNNRAYNTRDVNKNLTPKDKDKDKDPTPKDQDKDKDLLGLTPQGQGQGQGPDPQGPGQGQGPDPQGPGQGQGRDPQGPGQGQGLEKSP